MKTKFMMKDIKTVMGVVICCAFPLVGGICGEVIAQEKVFQWKFTSHSTATNTSVAPYEKWWSEQVEKRSNGQIKIKIYWMGEITGPKEMMSAISSRLVDLGDHVPSYNPGEIPIWNSTYLPFVAARRPDHRVTVYNRLARESKPYMDEMKKVNVIYGGAYSQDGGGYNLMGLKPVRTVEGLKGLRIRSMPSLGEILKEFGASPMSVAATEMYTAMSTGLIDVVAQSVLAFDAYKINELSKYLTLRMDMGDGPGIIFINKAAWDELPDNLKKIVQSVVDDSPSFMWKHQNDPVRHEAAEKVIKNRGIEVINFPEPERQKLVKKAEMVWEDWARRSGNYENAKKALADCIRVRDEVEGKLK